MSKAHDGVRKRSFVRHRGSCARVRMPVGQQTRRLLGWDKARVEHVVQGLAEGRQAGTWPP